MHLSESSIIQIGLGVVAGLGTLLIFVLRGIRDNQTRIWDWAKDETREISHKIDRIHEQNEEQMREMWRWVRHEFRSIYGELIEISKHLGKPGEDIVDSIQDRLKRMDQEK